MHLLPISLSRDYTHLQNIPPNFFDRIDVLSNGKMCGIGLALFVIRRGQEAAINTACLIPFSVHLGEHFPNH